MALSKTNFIPINYYDAMKDFVDGYSLVASHLDFNTLISVWQDTDTENENPFMIIRAFLNNLNPESKISVSVDAQNLNLENMTLRILTRY